VLALVWQARATGAAHYLAAATRYVDFVYRHRLDPARFGRASKFGYAMLQLFEETGDPQLLARARHLGDVLVETQSADGLWDPRPAVDRPVPPYERFTAAADCACTIFGLAGLP
jgi:rhamnogalacturonyl hydrolase YesR